MGEYCVAASTPTYCVVRSGCDGGLGEGFDGCFEECDGEVMAVPASDVVDGRRETAVGTLEERCCGETGA